MKDKIKLLSIAAVFVLLICAGYSILSFKQTDLQSILKKESSKKDLFIDHNESRVCSIQYEAKDNRTEKIYFEFADKYIFDGNSKFGVSEIETMIKADTQVQEVMAASILAKVTRDKIMLELDLIYPAYGFAAHKGYGTAAHIEAIRTHGLSAAHRESFKPKKLQATLF